MRSNEDQLELFASLLEPAAEILADSEIAMEFKTNRKPVRAVKKAILNHKQAVVELLAAMDGVDVKEYKVPGPAVLAVKVMKLLNDPDLTELFTTQDPKKTAAASGSATETIEDGAN